jgi:MSHA biogenesis protein MshI
MLRPLKKAFTKHARAGVASDGRTTGLARVQRLDDDRLSLAARILVSPEDGDMWSDDTASQYADMGMSQTRVATVLSANAYQLQPVELPNVPAEERLAAVRWRIKDLINFPLEEAVVELLEMPPHTNAGTAPIAYAVVTRQTEVLRQIEAMERADLPLDVIDIPELCMRNIAVMLPQDEYGVAFLHFTEDCGYLTITRGGVLHLMRRLDSGRQALANSAGDAVALQKRLDDISLDVQRSLDYYESHYDCRPITEIILSPGSDLDALPASLAEHLDLTVSRLDFDDLFRMEDELSADEQGDCLLAIGAALRADAAVQPAVLS